MYGHRGQSVFDPTEEAACQGGAELTSRGLRREIGNEGLGAQREGEPTTPDQDFAESLTSVGRKVPGLNPVRRWWRAPGYPTAR